MGRWFVLLAFIGGCGSDQGGNGTPDASVPVPDAPIVVPDASAAMLVARGDYLVNHVSACGDCHTPRNTDGTPDLTKAFSGVDCFLDVDPSDPNVGCIASRNLTNDPTGLANRTDQEIKDMFQKGIRPGGQFLNPYMPYSVFANMTADDASAVVAYLRTVPGVSHTVAASQPPFNNVQSAAPPLIPELVPRDPHETASTANGRYLVGMAGVCIICHTPLAPPGSAIPLDLSKLLAGGQDFQPGFPSPPFPAHIYSRNLTQDATGLLGYTPEQIVRILKQGLDKDGNGVCPPMPAGPMAAFGGLTDGDALDIANYLLTLPPIVNQIPNDCVAPGP